MTTTPWLDDLLIGLRDIQRDGTTVSTKRQKLNFSLGFLVQDDAANDAANILMNPHIVSNGSFVYHPQSGGIVPNTYDDFHEAYAAALGFGKAAEVVVRIGTGLYEPVILDQDYPGAHRLTLRFELVEPYNIDSYVDIAIGSLTVFREWRAVIVPRELNGKLRFTYTGAGAESAVFLWEQDSDVSGESVLTVPRIVGHLVNGGSDRVLYAFNNTETASTERHVEVDGGFVFEADAFGSDGAFHVWAGEAYCPSAVDGVQELDGPHGQTLTVTFTNGPNAVWFDVADVSTSWTGTKALDSINRDLAPDVDANATAISDLLAGSTRQILTHENFSASALVHVTEIKPVVAVATPLTNGNSLTATTQITQLAHGTGVARCWVNDGADAPEYEKAIRIRFYRGSSGDIVIVAQDTLFDDATSGWTFEITVTSQFNLNAVLSNATGSDFDAWVAISTEYGRVP